MHNDKFRTIIALFLQALYKCIETLAFLNICLKDQNRNGIITKSFLLSETDLIIAEIISAREHTDVYFEVCLQSEPPLPGKRGNSEGVKAVPGFWIDIDIAGPNHKATSYPSSLDESLNFLSSLPWKASLVVSSGGGIHVYYLFSTPLIINEAGDREKIADLSRRVNRFVIKVGQKYGWKIDNTSDLARLLRVPGTLNHKSVPAKEVSVIEYDTSVTYSVEDFLVALDEAIILDEICEPATTNALPSIISSNQEQEDFGFSEKNIDLIEKHCSWMAHCKYDAASLPEPDWFAACSIWVRCLDGRNKAHERSQAYPGYDRDETDRKLDNALNAKPRTCASILSDLSAGQYCSSCFYRGKGKSPISLGNVDEVAQARIVVSKTIKEASANPRIVFEEKNLAALVLLKNQSRWHYIDAINAFKKLGIPKGDLMPILNRFLAIAKTSSLGECEPYEVLAGRICVNRPTTAGARIERLSNFNAQIIQQIINDDGSGSLISFKIEGILETGVALPTITLSSQEFESMGWIISKWGAQAWYSGVSGTKEHLRAAITFLSKDFPTLHIYTHTGWRKVSEEWVFLSEAGGISHNGIVESLTVDLSGSHLSAFSIVERNVGLTTQEAIKKCLLLLDLLPKRISFSLLSAVFRAPLGEPLPVTFALFIVGATGTRKTEVAAIAQSFFGSSFNGKNLPSNWSSTANAIEKSTYLTKDVLVVIDDYLPGDNPRQMNAKADRVFRALGNQAGRQRMNADTDFHQEYYPRALIVSTAEDVPSGQSLTGRMLVLEIAEGDVDLGVLTELQQLSSKGVFTGVMYNYLKWLAPQIDDLKKTLPPHKAELRAKAVEAEKTHTRTPDIIADLAIGFQSFCTFAISQGAMTEEESTTLQADCWANLLEAAGRQQSQQKTGDPCERFRDLLNAAFLLGWAHLESTKGGAPAPFPEQWGWKAFPGQKDETGVPGNFYSPQGSQIGWEDHSFVYLESEAAFNIAQRVGGKDRPISISLKTLILRLSERKHLVPDPTGGNTVRMKGLGGRRPRVLQIHKSFFEDKDDAAHSTASSGQVSGFVIQPKESLSGAPQLKDALLQKTLDENLFIAFSENFSKK